VQKCPCIRISNIQRSSQYHLYEKDFPDDQLLALVQEEVKPKGFPFLSFSFLTRIYMNFDQQMGDFTEDKHTTYEQLKVGNDAVTKQVFIITSIVFGHDDDKDC
jgi:hypothetical protein